MLQFATLMVLASALFGVQAAHAQDLPDDDPLGDKPEPTNRQEREALENDKGTAVELPEEQQKRRIIQTFQRKTFLKLGRYELSPHVGFVTNDPFINRYLLGVAFTYHPTEVLGVEVAGTFSLNLGNADRKPVTNQIIDSNGVTPDISKIQLYVEGNVEFSPIYGKVAIGGERIIGFDIYGVFGTGAVQTLDDLEALKKEDDPEAQATQSQWHPSLNYGGGVRVELSPGFAVRLEGRGLSYIEVIESSTLEMKNNFTLLASASLFFPGMD